MSLLSLTTRGMNRLKHKQTQKRFFCGTVSATTGRILEVHTFAEARKEGYPHAQFWKRVFSMPQVCDLEKGTSQMFMMDDYGKIVVSNNSSWLLNAIYQQVTL